jgi:hypothetical protein
MAKYRVLTQSFIDNRLVNEGDVIDHDGAPHDNLEPLDAEGEAAKAAAATSDIEAIARQKAAAIGANPDEVDTVAATTAAAKAAEQTLQENAGAAGLV